MEPPRLATGSGYNCYQRIVDGKEDLDFKPIRPSVNREVLLHSPQIKIVIDLLDSSLLMGQKPATLVNLKTGERNDTKNT